MEKLELYYKENFDGLVKKTNRVCGNYHDAEDIVQDAFERAVKYIHTCKDMDRWFNTILRNTYRDFVRRKMNWPVTKPIEDCFDELEAVIVDYASPSMLKSVMEMVDREGEPNRTILTLHIQWGFSQGEICCLVDNVSISNVNNTLNRFKQKVIKRFK